MHKFANRTRVYSAACVVLATLLLPLPAGADTPPDFEALTTRRASTDSAPISMRAKTAMIAIPAGRYTLGRDDGASDERPAHAVDIKAFRIDRTEVTNAAFAEYLNALPLNVRSDFAAGQMRLRNVDARAANLLIERAEGAGPYAIIALDDSEALIAGTGGRFVAKPGFENHPVTETTWAGARAYCAWRGARLPTEAEWEAAARGSDGRLYPWGNAVPTADRAFVSRRTGVTSEVGMRPAGASPFGALDMSGSLAEWTSTLKRPYPYEAADGREDPTRSGERVTRGGDYVFDTAPEVLTATHRNGFSNRPGRGHRHIGFRCAADANT